MWLCVQWFKRWFYEKSTKTSVLNRYYGTWKKTTIIHLVAKMKECFHQSKFLSPYLCRSLPLYSLIIFLSKSVSSFVWKKATSISLWSHPIVLGHKNWFVCSMIRAKEGVSRKRLGQLPSITGTQGTACSSCVLSILKHPAKLNVKHFCGSKSCLLNSVWRKLQQWFIMSPVVVRPNVSRYPPDWQNW